MDARKRWQHWITQILIGWIQISGSDVCVTEITYSFFLFSEEIKVSVNDFIIKAAAVALKVSAGHVRFS